MTGSPRLSNDVGHLLDLSLRTAEGTKLNYISLRILVCGEIGRQVASGVG